MRKSKGIENIDELTQHVDELVSRQVVGIISKVYNTLRGSPPTGTPVDTGWASSNWTISLGKPNEGLVGSKSSVVKRDNGLALLKNYHIRKSGDIFLQNNVPYIHRLNAGWSKQSPAGFIEAAIDAATIEGL